MTRPGRKPGTVLYRLSIRDSTGRLRDRDEAIAVINRRSWSAEAHYLTARGRWHVFERPGVEPHRVNPRRSGPRASSGKRPGLATRDQLRALLEANATLLDEATRAELDHRPRTRGDCVDGERPCPWVACRHHLALDVQPETGSIKLNFPHIEPGELPESCSLDVAERGPQTLDAVGKLLNVTRERLRQIETVALRRLRSYVRNRL